MSHERILVVDDDPNLGMLLSLGLGRAGYTVRSETDGATAIRNWSDYAADLVILDVMMPRLDGWQTLQLVRQISDVPVLMLTAKTSDTDVAKGLDLGADDYLGKPFSLLELEARIRALLRRRSRSLLGAAGEIVVGPITVDSRRRRVLMEGRIVAVTPTEFRILAVLAANAGSVVPLDYLLQQVWGAEFTAERDYVKPYISRLRKKLNTPLTGPGALQTVYGQGYILASG